MRISGDVHHNILHKALGTYAVQNPESKVLNRKAEALNLDWSSEGNRFEGLVLCLWQSALLRRCIVACRVAGVSKMLRIATLCVYHSFIDQARGEEGVNCQGPK